MWWKLTCLAIITVLLIFSIIPFQTHTVAYLLEPGKPPPPPPPRPSWSYILSNMYLTPGTIILISFILIVASIVAVRIIRRSGCLWYQAQILY